MAFWAMPTVSPLDGRTAWTVVDDDYVVQPEAAEFLFALRFASDRAEGTCRTYARHLSLFFTWLEATGRDWRTVEATDLASFVLWLERTPSRRGRDGRQRAKRPGPPVLALGVPARSAGTINGITTAVRELYRFLVVHGRIDDSVAARLSARQLSKRTVKRAPKHLRVEQATALLEACGCERDRLLVLLLWRCGLRLSEALGLRREDLHLLASSTHVGCEIPGAHVHVIRRESNDNGAVAKSRWPRVVPASAEVADAYAAYRWERQDVADAAGNDLVFVNLAAGKIGAGWTPASVEDLFRRLSRRVGFRARPHMLRHSFGTELTEAGVALDVVQMLMGHAWISSTQVYVHPSWERMRTAVDHLSNASAVLS